MTTTITRMMTSYLIGNNFHSKFSDLMTYSALLFDLMTKYEFRSVNLYQACYQDNFQSIYDNLFSTGVLSINRGLIVLNLNLSCSS